MYHSPNTMHMEPPWCLCDVIILRFPPECNTTSDRAGQIKVFTLFMVSHFIPNMLNDNKCGSFAEFCQKVPICNLFAFVIHTLYSLFDGWGVSIMGGAQFPLHGPPPDAPPPLRDDQLY